MYGVLYVWQAGVLAQQRRFREQPRITAGRSYVALFVVVNTFAGSEAVFKTRPVSLRWGLVERWEKWHALHWCPTRG